MGHGGKRAGAGRPEGTPNKATKERQAKVAASGPTPLDVLIAGMRFNYEAAQVLMSRADLSEDETNELRALLGRAGAFASDAAPYVHPRLAQVQSNSTVEHRYVIELPALPTDTDQWQQQYAPKEITKSPGAPNGHNSH